MTPNWQTLLPAFDLYSYYAGLTAAFAEVVGAGVKQLALSHPYTAVELAIMLEPSRQIGAEHGIVLMVEADLLLTPLFPANVATGRQVILLAQNQPVLAAYQTLKERRRQAEAHHRLAAEAEALAWAFGHLLSYSDDRIQALISNQL